MKLVMQNESVSGFGAVVGGGPRVFLPPLRFGEGGTIRLLTKGLSALCFLVFAFCITSSAAGQDDPAKPETPTHNLVLKPVGPPVPSFRYELLPGLRDQTRNNAALLHHRALHLLNDYRPPGREFFEKQEKYQEVLKQPIKEFPRDEVRAFLKPYGNVFREMEAAAKCDRCEWGTEDRVAAEGIGFLLPDAQKMRELAFLLTLRCRLHAADGKIDLALKDVQTGFALARHAAQGPTLIHFLIGTAISAMVVTELEQVMQTPECPNLYWSLTALPRPLIDLRKGIEGELRSMESTIPLPKDVEKGPMTPEEALAALDKLWSGIQKLAESNEQLGLAESRLGLAFYITLQHPSARKALIAAGKTEAELDAMPPAQVVMLDALVRFRNTRDEYFVWFNAPYPEAIQGMRRSEQRLKEAHRSPPTDFMQIMLDLLLPGVEKVYAAQVRTERRIASLRTVEAVRLHAAKNDGKLPASLAEVNAVPVPADPVTGKPFEYLREGNTFTVNVTPPPGDKPDQGNHWKYVVTVRK
jgi:hypothetical protein